MPQGMMDTMPKVTAKFNNGEEKVLFEFYPDEISFSEYEFIGLTVQGAKHLKFLKDLKYLQQ